MGVSLGDLEHSFDELGVVCDNSVLNKCLEICNKHNIQDAEEFVDTWMAYSLSKLHGENPTISYLIKFERDEYSKWNKDARLSEDSNRKPSLVIYEASNMEVNSEPTFDILKVYDESQSKGKNGFELRTPDNSKKARNRSSPQAIFSPASFSPTITSQSSKYTSRTNSGQVVFPYKSDRFLTKEIENDSPVNVERMNSVEIQRYMNFDLTDSLDNADNFINNIAQLLMEKNGLDDPMPVRYKYPSPFITFGRIACDSDGRLNSKSVVLEGSRDSSFAETIQLDLESVEKYSVFPGQVVVIEGINITGDKLVAQKIFSDASLPPQAMQLSCGPLNITIAAGPYTQSDSMTYQPLLDLIDSVASDCPDVLILTGPFIDCNHPVINENSLAETYQDLFKKLVDRIMTPLKGKKTQVFMVASYRDCTANCVYPTPELYLKDKLYSNLHLLPDPSLLSVDGVIFGVTSTDCLMHIGKEEISSPGYSADRLSRLAAHVLSQRSFYPLSPPFGVPIDPLFVDFAKLNVSPHVLILPSDLRYFIKDVSGCIVVNPERLAKGVIGGTYARLSLTSTGVTGNIVRI